MQLKPHSLEPSDRTITDYTHMTVGIPHIVAEPRIVTGARLGNTFNNSNSFMSASGQAASGIVNFSQTANELSAILPPKHNNSKARHGSSLRGGVTPTQA